MIAHDITQDTHARTRHQGEQGLQEVADLQKEFPGSEFPVRTPLS